MPQVSFENGCALVHLVSDPRPFIQTTVLFLFANLRASVKRRWNISFEYHGKFQVIALDISKAFDKCWRPAILNKLPFYYLTSLPSNTNGSPTICPIDWWMGVHISFVQLMTYVLFSFDISDFFSTILSAFTLTLTLSIPTFKNRFENIVHIFVALFRIGEWSIFFFKLIWQSSPYQKEWIK